MSWDDDKLNKENRNWTFFWGGLKNMWQLLGDYKRVMVISSVWMLVGKSIELFVPYLLKVIFDQIDNIINGQVDWRFIGLVVASMVILRIIQAGLRAYLQDFMFVKGAIALESLWPVQAQKKLLDLSIAYHETENTGKKISKINKGCNKLVDLIVELFWDFFPLIFYFIVNVIFILIIDWKLGLLFMLPFYPAMRIHFKIFDQNSDKWEEWECQKEEADGYFCQSIINVKTVQNFVQEKKEVNYQANMRKSMADLDIGIHKTLRWPFFCIGVMLDLSFLLTIALGLYFVYLDWSSLGTVVYILATGNITIKSIGDIMHAYTRMMRKMIAVNHMKDLLDKEPEIVSVEKALKPKKFMGKFSFNDVHFSYNGNDTNVLHNFTANFRPGQMLALVGRSGEGKSTIVKILQRVYDVTAGSITLDGKDIRQLDLNWYRRQFATVQQDVDIFDATLFENIAYPAIALLDVVKVEEAVRAAHLHVMLDDKERFPFGLNTQVGERGVRLSGGEKQRVGIARAYIALLCGAKVLILDEATSSLDSESESAIQSMIAEVRAKQNISIVVIAHRLPTIKEADQICVLENGKVVEQGKHSCLVGLRGRYAKWVTMQDLN